MTLTRENRFLVTLGSVVLAGAIVLLVLLMRARGAYKAISQEYDTQAAELSRLQTLAPYPDQANLDATNDQLKQYAGSVGDLLGKLSKLNFPLENLTPNQFQDRLREVVSTIAGRAAEKGVALPANFYLDFDPYKDSLPRSSAVPALARQLKAAELLANLLIDARVTSVNSFTRGTLEEEAPPKTGTPAGGGDPAGALPPLIQHQAITAGFTCEAGQLRQVANEILRAPQFFIIRSLRVHNQAQKGPPKVLEDILAAAPAPAGPDGSPANPEEPRRLQFIVGKEKLDVVVRVEIVNFGPQELVARAAGQAPAATPKP
jgi:hypothetical protein